MAHAPRPSAQAACHQRGDASLVLPESSYGFSGETGNRRICGNSPNSRVLVFFLVFFFWKLKSDSEAERDAATGLQSPVLLTPFAWSRAVPRLAGSLAWCRLEALFARRVPKRCVRASV